MRSSTRGRLSARRTARRSSGLLPLISTLDRKQRVDAAHHLDGDRRERNLGLSGSLAARVLLDVGEDEELAPRMRPARRLQDRAGLAVREIELVVAVVGVRLQDAGVAREMRLRMLAAPVARVVEDRGRRPGAAERLIVADVDPEPAGVGLAFGQHRHGRVVAVQALGRHDMGLDQAPKRIERRRDRADGVGHGGERDRRALERVALGLPVQRLVLAELLEHDHRQQARARPCPRDHMERRRRLADLLAVPAGELLPHRLDHLPPPRRRLQRLRHVLAELAQAIAAAARAGGRRIDHHALARQMVGERVALGAPAGEGAHRRRLRGRLLRRQFVFGWRWPPAPRTRAPAGRSAAPTAPTAARRSGARAWRSGASARRSAPCLPRLSPARPPAPPRLPGPARARRRAPPSGRRRRREEPRRRDPCDEGNHNSRDLRRPKMRLTPCFSSLRRRFRHRAQPALLGRHVSCGFRQSIPSSM